jgi:hypothetical protein
MGAGRTSRLRPCPSARLGVASARATRAEGDRPPFRAARSAGLHKRVPSLGEDRRKARKTGETARVGAGFGRRFTLARVAPVAAKPLGGTMNKGQPQERQHSAAVRRDAGRLPCRDRLRRHPQEGQHRAIAERGGTRDRVPPARYTLSSARDRSHWPRRCAARFTRARCGACRTHVKRGSTEV